jgi:hypothetical protein
MSLAHTVVVGLDCVDTMPAHSCSFGACNGCTSAAPLGMLQSEKPSDSPYVHDPYSFASYAIAHMSFECSDLGSSFSSDSAEQTHSASDGQSGNESDDDLMARRRKRVLPPCGHDQYKRLRFKKGLSHFLCTVCSTKWKQSGV